MKLSKTLTLLIMIAFTASLIFSGCKAESQAELTPSQLACIELMQKVPVYYEDFEFWDVKTLRNDADLGEMYQIWYERRVEFLEENYGLKSSSIDYLAQGEGLLDIYKAEYDIQAIRDRIAVDFYRDMTYEDTEVWKSEPAYDPQSVTGGWVLAEGLLVRGANNSNVDDYLRVTSGKELSTYDKNAAEVLARLPEGIMTRIFRYPYPEGLIVSGDSIEKVEGSTLRWTSVYKFESPDDIKSVDAEKYFKGIEDEFSQAESELSGRGEAFSFHDFSLERKGEFVKWSMLIEEKYMIALLFYG
jgi:hypothetical protein